MKHSIRALALVLVIAGCSKGGNKVVNPPVVEQPPTPNSPVNAVKLFEWAQEHRDTLRYREVLAGEFVFLFQPADPAGLPYAGQWNRNQENVVARHMFVGGGSEPAATAIDLDFGTTFTAFADSRPGKNPTWHQQVTVSGPVNVTNPINTYGASGGTVFYLVRGDSAQIPADLAARGITADAARWFIETWEDQTLIAGPSTRSGRTRPSSPTEAHEYTWGRIKTVYVP
jgi:hypothetical protein